MFEIRVTIEAPEIVGALNRLSDAMSISAGNVLTQHPHAQMEAEAEKIETAAPAPAPAPVPVPTAPAPVPVAPAPADTTPAPAPTAPAPAPVPVPAAKPSQPKIDLDTISQAGAGLIDEGKMPEIMNLLKKYGVQAVTQLKPEQYTDFAADMRELGAKI